MTANQILDNEIAVAKADVLEAENDCIFLGHDGYGPNDALLTERLENASERLHILWTVRRFGS